MSAVVERTRLRNELHMILQLTDDQRQALEERGGAPTDIVDAATNARYVLVRAELYEQFKAVFDEEFDPRDVYAFVDRVMAEDDTNSTGRDRADATADRSGQPRGSNLRTRLPIRLPGQGIWSLKWTAPNSRSEPAKRWTNCRPRSGPALRTCHFPQIRCDRHEPHPRDRYFPRSRAAAHTSDPACRILRVVKRLFGNPDAVHACSRQNRHYPQARSLRRPSGGPMRVEK